LADERIPGGNTKLENLNANTKLGKLISGRGENAAALTVESIEEILNENSEDLFGGMNEPDKFFALKELSEVIKDHPQKKELGATLFELFKQLPVIEGEPKNWNEILIANEGGSVGLITDCLVVIPGNDFRLEIFDYLIRADDTKKMNILLERIGTNGKRADFRGLIENKEKEANSIGMKELLRKALSNN